jgi:adenylylsulfate kinase-like enzyme
VVIIAAINPFEDMREELKQQYKAKIVWIKCAVDELVNRDTKGLYKRALLPDGHPDKLYNFTGINDEYNEPVDYDLVLNTDAESIEDSTGRLFHWVIELLGH